MIATVLAVALAAQAADPQAFPRNATLAYTGLPTFASDQGALDVRSQSVTLTVRGGVVEGVSTTEIRNPASAVANVKVTIPEWGYATTKVGSGVVSEATWAGRPLDLQIGRTTVTHSSAPPRRWSSSRSATAYMPPRSTAALRITFRVPLGTAGLDRKLRVLAYELGGDQPIGQLNLTVRYDEREVFRLPEIRPAAGWQVGARGAFLRLQNFRPKGETVVATFYPGGFGDE
jgi:hypothetical protein